MKEKESIRTLKGVGEKTEKLFQKVGISTVGQLLRYYPRDYDIYREPVTVESLNDQETGAVLATLTSSLDMKKVRNLTVISGTIADASGRSVLVLKTYRAFGKLATKVFFFVFIKKKCRKKF